MNEQYLGKMNGSEGQEQEHNILEQSEELLLHFKKIVT